VESYESEDESDKLLPDKIYNLWRDERINKIPWMIGVNNAEWIHVAAGMLSDLNVVDGLNNNWLAMAPYIYATPYGDSPARDLISKTSREFYFGDKDISNDTLWNLTHLSTDRDIIHGSKFLGAWMARYGMDSFFYYLSKRPAKSYSDAALIGYPPGDYGAAHADELQYLFDYYGYPEYLEGHYYEFSRNLIKIWVQFAATGYKNLNPKIGLENL
jgi:carboxylesterase type B